MDTCKNCLHYAGKWCQIREIETTAKKKKCILFKKCVNMNPAITVFLIIEVLDVAAVIAFLAYYFWR